MQFIGIEAGLHGTRAVILNLESAWVPAEAGVPHAWFVGLPPGCHEHDPADRITAGFY